MSDLYEKLAKVLTPLQPHQQRAIDKLEASGGLLAFHGLGSGKTLLSLAAKDRLGVSSDVVVPAPLRANYDKEIKKHLATVPDDVRVRSYEQAAKEDDLDPSGLVVFDEAHRGRNAGTGPAKLLDQGRHAKYRLLMSATPSYNSPADIAPLLNAAAGRKVLPDDPNLFKQTFVGQTVEQAPLYQRIKGQLLGHPVNSDPQPTLINRDRLVQAARGYVDFHRGGGTGFPTRIDEEHHVDMSPKQRELYTFAEGKMPWYLRAKIRAGLPMNKQENKELNAFQGALRQISNTPRGFSADISDENEMEHSPKIQKVIEHLLAARKDNPNHRGVIYSNYLDSGVHPLSRALTRAGVAHSVFTGDVQGPRRAQMVNDYNSGKTPLLLLSGAGSEGLDLKGTRTVQLLEPHWHDQRGAQVEGRGIRYMSHAHLPEEERNVRVMKYYSAIPKDVEDRLGTFIGMEPKKSIEQYLKHMSNEKTKITNQIADALQEASDYGPLQKRSAEGVLDKYALSHDVLQKIIARMGDSTLGSQKREHYIEYAHPAGLTLRSPYDENFIHEQVKEKFEGNPDAYADQIRDDLLNMGYATLGQVTKKNQTLQRARAMQGARYGSLLGVIPGAMAGTAIGGAAAMGLARRGVENTSILGGVGTLGYLAGATLVPIAAGTLGFQLGKHTYKPLGTEDVIARNTHPLLMPPKPVKAKVKLDVKEK